ncbi:hypothetical protein [Corallococcus sp. AS-1-6]|uniref:hypothetical protein n=1 Tax=Corallococcus sp. AS-1-6 TaxID=2874599 RepID=UPI001CC0367F|nr:hypothetical protein [Corallococcus sp. AS-1-6]MBZ4375435.1 hypothetical protein [Corallococcus sp. AS-1-6]
MSRVIIVNGSPAKTGYWANEQTGKNSFVLLTHCAAAKELAVAWKQKDVLCWFPTGMAIGFRGPLVLARWQRDEGFFKLSFEGIAKPTKVTRTRSQTDKVLSALKHGQHLVICDGAGVTFVNMETRPHPLPSEVEEALYAARVPSQC